MAVFFALALAQDPSEWARRLADPDVAVREAAMEDLRSRHAEARETLAWIAANAEPEAAERARLLLAELDRWERLHGILLEAPPFELAPRDGPVPVADLLDRLARHFGSTVRADGLEGLAWSEPLRAACLLEALDRIGDAAGLSYDVAADAIRVYRGAVPAHPAGYAGPLRVSVEQVQVTRTLNFQGTTVNAWVELRALHPRRAIEVSPTLIRIAEARFADGTVAPVSSPNEMTEEQIWFGGMGMAPDNGALTHSFSPPLGAARVEAFEGTLTVAVPRDPVEVVVDRAEMGAQGSSSGITVTIRTLERQDMGEANSMWYGMVQLEYDQNMPGADLQSLVGQETEVALENAEGRRLDRLTDLQWGQMEGGLYFYLGVQGPTDHPPVRLRMRVPGGFDTAELPFVIRDVPLP